MGYEEYIRKQALKAVECNVAKIARMTGYNRSYVSLWMHGKRKSVKLAKEVDKCLSQMLGKN